MLRIFVRRSSDVDYFTKDHAQELDGIRADGPGWWLRGSGDTQDSALVAGVLRSTPRSSVYGYDMVIAAPRPLSILMALDGASAAGVIAAHRASVRVTVDYLEQHALVVRDRRMGGDFDDAAQWQSIVSFTHGLNRHGEPHLHDHVLVGARPADSSKVLDSRALFAHGAAGDAIYRSSFRHELAQRTTWSAWRSFEGIEHVSGLDEGYRSLWGGHHSDRGQKLHWPRSRVLEQWSRDLERWEPQTLIEAPRRDRRVIDEHSFGSALEGRLEVSRRHVAAAWADAATNGTSGDSLRDALDKLYPELTGGRGVHEPSIGLSEARMIARVRALGPRPLEATSLDHWRQRERSTERSRSGRSR